MSQNKRSSSIVTTLSSTSDSTDRRAAYETAITTGDRTVIFDGTTGNSQFYMTGRDIGSNDGLLGAKGATIVFKGAPAIFALPTSGSDRALFAFQSGNDATAASSGVNMFSDTKSDDPDEWAQIDAQGELDSVVIFEAQGGHRFNCVGGSIKRVAGYNGIKHGFNLRPGGIISKWYYESDTSDAGGDAVHTFSGNGNQSPSVLIEDGILGPMPNAINGRQIKVSELRTATIRNIRFSADAINATNKWTINLAKNIGTCIIQNCDLPGGITHTAGGDLSCDLLLVEDCRLGEGTATPTMGGGLGLDRLHADVAATRVIYRRVNFDGIDRFCFQPRDGGAALLPAIDVENCTFRSYNNTALNAPNGRPMLTFNATQTTFRVRGTNTLTGVDPNGLISSSNATAAAAWTSGVDTGFVKRDMDIYSLSGY